MGIPSQFWDIIRRFPNKIVVDQITERLNELYLDLNCCIHNCAAKVRTEHGQQEDYRELFERRVIQEVIRTIERLVTHTRPNELLQVAIDGPVPLAKMYRQRQRRFRSAETKRRMREEFPEKSPEWDTNQITPGTPFMVALSEKVARSLPRIARENGIGRTEFSPHDIPGEGEQKIAEQIREGRTEGVGKIRGIYGLDADLIMISLLLDAEDPPSNQFLVREKVVFGSVLLDQFGDTEYCYLWATSLATHIRAEIGEGGSGGGGISRRSIIHDYVFLAFLLGNDFLPHIPSMRFRNDGMDKLLEAMRDIREPLILPNPLFPDTRVLVRYLTRLSQDEISVLHGNNMRQVKLIESYRRGTLKFLMDADTPEKKYAAELEQEHLGKRGRSCLDIHRGTPDTIVAMKYQESFITANSADIGDVASEFYKMMCWTWNYQHSRPVNWRVYFPQSSGPLLSDLCSVLREGGAEGCGSVDAVGDEWRPSTEYQRTIVLPPISHRLCGLGDSVREEHGYLYPESWTSHSLWCLHGWECEENLPILLVE